jgi:hypothetical protein
VSVLVAVPFVVLFARAFASSWLPNADLAAIELRVRDVGGARTPLLGAYSRYGWNHPGPLMFYVLAVPYRLLGAPSWGLLASAVLVNATWVGCCVWLLWRRGGLAGLVLGAVPLVLLVHAVGSTFLEQAWNPYLIVFALFALAIMAWSIACGDHMLLPLAVGTATFAVQTHVGSLLPATALVLVALAFLGADARRGRVRHPLRILVLTAVVGVALWLPAIVQELQSGRGNLTKLWDFWTSNQGPTPGFATGARLLGPQFGVAPPFVTGHESVNVFSAGVDPRWTVPLALLLLAGATLLAYVRHDRTSFTLDVVALSLAFAAWVSAARIVGEPYVYIVRWMWIVGAIAWLAIGWTAARALRAWLPRRHVVSAATAAGLLAVGALCFLIGASTVAAARAKPPDAIESAVLRRIDGPTRASLTTRPQPVLVKPAGSFGSAVVARGLLLRLARGDIDAGIQRTDADVVGEDRVVAPTDARTTIVVATEDGEIARYAGDPAYREITRFDALSRATRAEYTALGREVAAHHDDLAAWISDHSDAWARWRALSVLAARTVVFERR